MKPFKFLKEYQIPPSYKVLSAWDEGKYHIVEATQAHVPYRATRFYFELGGMKNFAFSSIRQYEEPEYPERSEGNTQPPKESETNQK